MKRKAEDDIPGRNSYIDGILGRTTGHPNEHTCAMSAREAAAHGVTVSPLQDAIPKNTDEEFVARHRAQHPPSLA